MAKNEILVLGLVGVGGYLVWQYWPEISQWFSSLTGTAPAPAGQQAVQAAGTPAAQQQAVQQTQQAPGFPQVSSTVLSPTAGGGAMASELAALNVPMGPGATTFSMATGPIDPVQQELAKAGITFGITLPAGASSSTSSSGGSLPSAGSFTLGGLGAIRVLPGQPVNTSSNLLYRAHHPQPYLLPGYRMLSPRGLGSLGAMTQASGLEKALFGRQPLRSNRIV